MGIAHSTPRSFVYAFRGMVTAFKEEPNFKIHITLASLAIILGFVLQLPTLEWLVLVLTICIVLVVELINTALEEIVNIVSPEIRPEAKIAKDVAASAVLISAIASIVVGALLFVPKMLLFLQL